MKLESAVDTDLLKKFIPLNGLRTENLVDLAKKATIRSLTPNQVLFKAGDATKEAMWVIEGTIQFRDADDKPAGSVVGGDSAAQHRLAHQSPRKVTAKCESAAKVLCVDSGLLDVMLTWDQTGSFEVSELSGEDNSDDDWMGKLLTIPTFQMVPPANLQAMFMRLETIIAKPGQVIVKQDEDGDYFYVINSGTALVTREQPNQKPVRLAELNAGACFGEEALISDSKRNATITMLTSGRLMRLSKDDFQQLLNEPLARKIGMDEAATMVASGNTVWLDVRLPSEFKSGSLPGAINLPLYMLRPRLAALTKDKTYVACCDTGRRSSVAVFVLTQKGYDAYMLEGGIPAK